MELINAINMKAGYFKRLELITPITWRLKGGAAIDLGCRKKARFSMADESL
jgi:hypothetical protein